MFLDCQCANELDGKEEAFLEVRNDELADGSSSAQPGKMFSLKLAGQRTAATAGRKAATSRMVVRGYGSDDAKGNNKGDSNAPTQSNVQAATAFSMQNLV